MHIEAPTRHDIEGKTPTIVYFSYKMQAMTYSVSDVCCIQGGNTPDGQLMKNYYSFFPDTTR